MSRSQAIRTAVVDELTRRAALLDATENLAAVSVTYACESGIASIAMWFVADSRLPSSIFAVRGVYALVDDESNARYIGSSINVKSRIKCHIRMLKAGRHHSRKFQQAFDDGNGVLLAAVLGECSTEDLIRSEQAHIDSESILLNASRCARRPITYGPNIKLRGHVVSPETRARISVAKLGKSPDRVYAPISDSQKLMISKANTGRRRTQAWKDENSKRMKVLWQSPEFRVRILAARAGCSRKPHSEQTKQKLRIAALARRGRRWLH